MHKAGAASPNIISGGFGKYRHIVDIGLFCGPFFGQGVLVQIRAALGAPINEDRALAFLGDGVFDNRLDRRETSTAGDQDDRLDSVFAQIKSAVRAVDAQDVAALQGAENLLSEQPPRDVANVQLQHGVVMRRIGQGKAAFFAVLEQNIDVLAGPELQPFAGRQAEVHFDDVRRQFFQLFDTRRQCLWRNVIDRAKLLAFDDQIRFGMGATVKRQPVSDFFRLEGVTLCFAVVDRAREHFSLAGTTGAILAAVGQGQALAQCGVKQCFIGFGGKLAATRLNGNLVAHLIPRLLGYNAGVENILIVGSGDVARRILSRLAQRYRVYALLRDATRAASWRAAGAIPLLADLDDPASLQRLCGLADRVLHLAPPPANGAKDTRTRHLLAALSKSKSLPRQLVYVSTTGVYGDCAGAQIDETRCLNPESARAKRRADAERYLRQWGADVGVRVSILRAPGIYASDRLPVERLKKGLPALAAADDVFTNHIHADDLAAACIAALRHGQANRVYNIVDDSDLQMAEYFDRVADAFALPRPPRMTRQAAEQALSAMQMSFMRESRRIDNRRLKNELKLRLAFPNINDGIAEALSRSNPCWS